MKTGKLSQTFSVCLSYPHFWGPCSLSIQLRKTAEQMKLSVAKKIRKEVNMFSFALLDVYRENKMGPWSTFYQLPFFLIQTFFPKNKHIPFFWWSHFEILYRAQFPNVGGLNASMRTCC